MANNLKSKCAVAISQSEHELVQDIVTNVANVSASVTQTVWACTNPQHLSGLLCRIQARLRRLQGRLPYRDRIFGPHHGYPTLQTIVFHTHLLHNGTLMMVSRRCLSLFRSSKHRDALSDNQRQIVNKTIEDGLVAAQQTVQILCHLRETSRSVRQCWITMYVA